MYAQRITDIVVVHINLPFNYCKPGVNLSNPDELCASNLCLHPVHSLSAFQWEVTNCCSAPRSISFSWLILLLLAAVVLRVFLCLESNLTVSVRTINGLIFYANNVRDNLIATLFLKVSLKMYSPYICLAEPGCCMEHVPVYSWFGAMTFNMQQILCQCCTAETVQRSLCLAFRILERATYCIFPSLDMLAVLADSLPYPALVKLILQAQSIYRLASKKTEITIGCPLQERN